LFACFVPCNSPEIAVAVIVEHGGHGGSAAAPIARKVIDAYFESKKYGGKVPMKEKMELQEISGEKDIKSGAETED
jgi:penicillin-binding protein 2